MWEKRTEGNKRYAVKYCIKCKKQRMHYSNKNLAFDCDYCLNGGL